ncbi:MAG: hypothetical protein UY53_C0002G0046 [Parcubacteria group bacterium GW2011_GWA2_50_10]|uniref:Uncharacterized protein n=1 Tax=Candidatus Yanofskybacteria bacterium GW2011_GWC1_48_11 TaxID=1619027 RepID=A0A837IL64_9BACT|nr:MAG: hypothetical protein UY25_C0002G0026 [Candidatus Yanofskybacteria bacterium GW2011_GWC1_48_11]KKW08974.1 MAG: hypothetical protein UY45_C0002G0026 [Parcubacteria group bacterium GW2011_GWA1_49_26]KKW14257.1 MAG: hypothetical protein UY53_C0002G0046 [Parcubacteria group bacterium GW2011_GWA2_50_10]
MGFLGERVSAAERRSEARHTLSVSGLSPPEVRTSTGFCEDCGQTARAIYCEEDIQPFRMLPPITQRPTRPASKAGKPERKPFSKRIARSRPAPPDDMAESKDMLMRSKEAGVRLHTSRLPSFTEPTTLSGGFRGGNSSLRKSSERQNEH